MNVDKFFNELNEKTWRNEKRFFVERKFDALIEYLQENKEEVLDDIIDDLDGMEKMQTEDKEIFDYKEFDKWVNVFAKDNMSAWLEEVDEEEE